MRKLLLGLTLITTFVHGQTENLEYKTKHGYNLKVGDTLILGVATSKQFEFAFGVVGNNFVGRERVKIPSTAQTAQIIVKKFKEEQGATYAVGDWGTVKNIYIQIDKALKSGEAVSKYSLYWKSRNIKPFNEESFIYYLKIIKGEPKDYANEYVFRYNKELYRKYKDDEFEYGDILNKATKELADKISTIKFGDIYALGLSYVDLKDYDFEKGGFPIELKGYTDWLTVSMVGTPGNTEVSVYFQNYTEHTFLPMDKERAKALIASRKDSYGSVNRNIFVRLYVSISDKLTPFTTTMYQEKKGITATIHWAEIYGNNNLFSDDIGVIDVRKDK